LDVAWFGRFFSFVFLKLLFSSICVIVHPHKAKLRT
jgi:hypothetical protein